MAVDFAYKLRTRAGDGWAIRNIKLRMSRKLVYCAGLLACFRCHFDVPVDERSRLFRDANRRQEVVNRLQRIFAVTPLESMAEVLLRYGHLLSTANKIFGSYDEFVGILADDEKRRRLETVKEDEADSDDLYKSARKLSHTFRDGVLEFFFDPKSEMEILTKTYGVF